MEQSFTFSRKHKIVKTKTGIVSDSPTQVITATAFVSEIEGKDCCCKHIIPTGLIRAGSLRTIPLNSSHRQN